jgi:hypothetical protein
MPIRGASKRESSGFAGGYLLESDCSIQEFMVACAEKNKDG